ncbi:hypothetical protein V498_05060 [Pseudogymnoascus sp. VKM F-4517 (FW-2822)]|nr:hypothetical protein V498_05060 [Pseudogymnoascus sp. VKM F-4517 (FW-2822)]
MSTAPSAPGHHDNTTLFSSHIITAQHRFTSNLQYNSPCHAEGKSPIRPPPADVRNNVQKYSSRQRKRKRANRNGFVWPPLSGSRRAREAGMRHTAAAVHVSFQLGRVLIRAGLNDADSGNGGNGSGGGDLFLSQAAHDAPQHQEMAVQTEMTNFHLLSGVQTAAMDTWRSPQAAHVHDDDTPNVESHGIEMNNTPDIAQMSDNAYSQVGAIGFQTVDALATPTTTQDDKEATNWKLMSWKLMLRNPCTQKCLLGLKRQSILDPDCPNVASHVGSVGSVRHSIDAKFFIRLIEEYLPEEPSKNINFQCVRLGTGGSTGTLFKLMLSPYEYVFVGKGTTTEFVSNLQHEAFVYEHRLEGLQGEAVPVYLGSIDLEMATSWSMGNTHGAAITERIVHMILMSWSGYAISETDVPVSEVSRSLQEVVRRGVIHNDICKDSTFWSSVRDGTAKWSARDVKRVMLSKTGKDLCYTKMRKRNMLWNSEQKRVMIIDFERSILIDDESDESDQSDHSDHSDQADQAEQSEQSEKPEHLEQAEKLEQLSQKQNSDAKEELPLQKTKAKDANVQSSSLGLLGTLPGELRKMIYEYAISVEQHTDGEAKTGLGLLRTSSMIFKETFPLLYQHNPFGVEFGDRLETAQYKYYKPRSNDPYKPIYAHMSLDILHFVRNLEIKIEYMDWQTGPGTILRLLVQLCNKLRRNIQLQNLDINITFVSHSYDIDVMAYVIGPIKTLRGVRNPNIFVDGYDHTIDRIGVRWDLTDEYRDYLHQLVMGPHGAPCVSEDGITMFDDFYEEVELEDDNGSKEGMTGSSHS